MFVHFVLICSVLIFFHKKNCQFLGLWQSRNESDRPRWVDLSWNEDDRVAYFLGRKAGWHKMLWCYKKMVLAFTELVWLLHIELIEQCGFSVFVKKHAVETNNIQFMCFAHGKVKIFSGQMYCDIKCVFVCVRVHPWCQRALQAGEPPGSVPAALWREDQGVHLPPPPLRHQAPASHLPPHLPLRTGCLFQWVAQCYKSSGVLGFLW